MYLVTVSKYAADGWFNLTILGPFSEDAFAHWCYTTGYFSDFHAQIVLKPLSEEGVPLSGLQRKRKSLQQLLETPV